MWENLFTGSILTYLLVSFTIHNVTSEEHHKRVPSGFTGVRGKKSATEEFENDNNIAYVQSVPNPVSSEVYSHEKRAPSSGFVGMRGKKPWDEEGNHMYYNSMDNGYPKRAPNYGFFGMRGKKLFNYYTAPSNADNYKRGPSSGFFGMRGKKFDYSLRGKKMPFEFRGKFVGVRGKKDMPYLVNGENDDLDQSLLVRQFGQNLDMNQLMLLLTENTTWDPQYEENESSYTNNYK